MTVKEIEKAVAELTAEELAVFRDWFAAYDADRWDEQIARDVAEGKLDRLIEEAHTEYAAGRTREI